MKKIILILFILVSISYSQWEQTSGPKGGHVTVILPHPDGTIYLGTYVNGVFKSTDDGVSWQDISIIQEYGVQATCMTFDNSYVYLGTNFYGVFRTSNHGLTWESTAPVNYNYIASLYAIGDMVYASSNGQLYVSTNHGNNWTQLSLNKNVNTMIYNNGYLITGSSNEVWRSPDFGNSWEPSNTSLQNLNDPEIIDYGNDLYIAGSNSLYRSSDNALTWTQLNCPVSGFESSITFNGSNLFIASDSGLFKSSDFGNSWAQINLGCRLSLFTEVKSADNVLLAGTYLSVYKSNDNGYSWENVNYNFNRESINHIIAYGSSNLLASVLRGAYISGTNGDEWTESINNRSRRGVNALDASGGIIYAGMYSGRLLKSADNGNTWNEIPDDSPGGFRITALDVNGEQILYGVTRNSAPVGGGIYYSTNSGQNWTSLGGSKYGVSDVAINGRFLYVASPFYLRGKKSLDVQWDTLIPYHTYDVELGLNYIFAYTVQGLKRSSDNGTTWEDITNGLNTDNLFNDMLYFDNRLYIALDSIFMSTNDGEQWYSINEGLSDTTITQITANDKYIFAATGSGVWRRSIDIIVKTPNKNKTPDRFTLFQNYPNPFNPVTIINYELPITNYIRLVIYDVLGKEIEVLVDKQQAAGNYQAEWDASNYPSGVYFYRLSATGGAGDPSTSSGLSFSETKKMILVK